jgi:hypothetical protein
VHFKVDGDFLIIFIIEIDLLQKFNMVKLHKILQRENLYEVMVQLFNH